MYSKKKFIIDKAINLGFDVIRFTEPLISRKNRENLDFFIQKNYFGEMLWMKRHYEKKIDPKKLWDKVKTIVVLGINYGPDFNPLIKNKTKEKVNISIYAQNKDYHLVIRNKLQKLIYLIDKKFSSNSKFFIDTAPVYEKPLAQKSGLGWHGKHTNIVSKKFGSWLFLSEVFLPFKLESDLEETDHCGSCEDCINICPTNAFVDKYILDARKCISYLTIEHKGPFPISLRKKIGNKVYGCDDCLSICPWNKFSKPTDTAEFISEKQESSEKISYFLNFNKSKFEKFFIHSPVKRIGWVSFIRNILIVAGNSKLKTLKKKVIAHMKNSNPIIRGTSVWSLGELTTKRERIGLSNKYFGLEKNEYVLFEWNIFNQK